jgi:hypothetical protein
MDWSCKECGLTLNVKKLIYPIRCSCGFFDRGDTIKKSPLHIRTPVSPWEKEYRLSICKSCKYFNNGRCVYIDLGCGRTFNKILNDPRMPCPKDKWDKCPSPFKTPITTRHCIYHIYAAKKDDIWLRNVEQVRKNTHIFNGKKIAAIAYDENTAPNDEVKKQLPGFEFIEMENDKNLREVATFPRLLQKVSAETKPGNAVFYAHTKGNTTTANKHGAAIWRNVMYRELLDNYEQCMEHMRYYIAVGIHKMSWPEDHPGPFPTKLDFGNRWMFAGTFFWFRADALFLANWRTIAPERYGAEAWISGSLKFHEGKSVYQVWDEDRYPDISPYTPLAYKSEDREKWKE